MEDEEPNEASNTDIFSELVELKIKTLDSQIYSFQVDKDMPVSLLKEKVTNDIGVPVGQQRLICRGKLLKDDHLLSEYHVENGHTLHLVERQPSQSHLSTDASFQASDANVGSPDNRVGQIPHSVVLGTLGSSEQSEGHVVPDLTRVIGAILNSFGVTGQPFINTTLSSPLGQVSEANFMQVGSQTQSSTGQPFQFPPQVMQIPLSAAATIPLPSLASPSPDSLNTLLEYMNRMEMVLSQNGYLQNMSSIDSSDLHMVELPLDTRGMPSSEALVIVMQHAEQLLNSYAIAALSRIAGRLDQERDSFDPSIRGQMQTELVQVGLSMQHFGALLLELGRTILTLQMGESPLESSLNAGPAVYISSSGLNPIIVQPFPLQTSSLFGGANSSSNLNTSGLVGIGSAPRHINIHIHAAHVGSTPGNGTSNGEGTQGEQVVFTSPIASSSVRVAPVRNVTGATTMLPHPTQPNGHICSSHALSESSLSSLLAELNSRVRNLAGNVQGENLDPSGNAQPSIINRQIDPTVSGFMPTNGNLKDSFSGGSCASSRGTSVRFCDENGNDAPLGLGMRGLETKRGGNKHTKSSSRSNDHNLDAASSQQLFESLATKNSSMNGMDELSTSSCGPTLGNSFRPYRAQGEADQFDAANVVSQLLGNPTLMNSLISGVSSKTDFGSPDMLGNLMQQFTRNPQIINMVGQFAQQADHNREPESLYSKLGASESGGVDMTNMVQQIMPVVSQALSHGSNPYGSQSNRQYEGMRSSTIDNYNDNLFQIDIQQLIKSVEEFDSPVDVFHAVVESAVQLSANDETCAEELLDEVFCDEDLAVDYTRVLTYDIYQRFQDAT